MQNELKVLLGTDQGDKLILKDGRELMVAPLTLDEIADAEIRLGARVTEWKEDFFNVRNSLYLVWLSVRASGLTPAQVEKQEWVIQERELSKQFPVLGIGKLYSVVKKLMELAGIMEPETPGKNGSGGGGKPESAPSSGSPSSTT